MNDANNDLRINRLIKAVPDVTHLIGDDVNRTASKVFGYISQARQLHGNDAVITVTVSVHVPSNRLPEHVKETTP